MNTKRFIDTAISRRRLLGSTVRLAVGGACAATLGGCGKESESVACADPAQLSDEQNSLRSSLRYTDRSMNRETCSACAFFAANADAPCGTCTLLKGPVDPQGHCGSWSARKDTPANQREAA